jgi:hypothetical protein
MHGDVKGDSGDIPVVELVSASGEARLGDGMDESHSSERVRNEPRIHGFGESLLRGPHIDQNEAESA